MNMISRIAVPIYEDRESCATFDRALQLAERFQSDLLVATILQEHLFLLPWARGPGVMGAQVDERGLKDFKARLSAIGHRLVDSAKERGLQTESISIRGHLPSAFAALTRQCDLLVDSQLQPCSLLKRLLGGSDVYRDVCCPVLVARGEPFAPGPVLLIYDRTRQANGLLRWVTQLAQTAEKSGLHVLVISRADEEQVRLPYEVSAITEARGVAVRIDAVTRKLDSQKVAELTAELRPKIVAVPAHVVHKVKALRDVQHSVLLL